MDRRVGAECSSPGQQCAPYQKIPLPHHMTVAGHSSRGQFSGPGHILRCAPILTDAARSVRQVRKDLGEDAIVGSFCGNSSHDAMTAGELGADYVAFGPVGQTALGDGRHAPLDLFQWWSQMIEIPVVAEGDLDTDLIEKLAPHTDFFGIGEEIWSADNPSEALKALSQAIG